MRGGGTWRQLPHDFPPWQTVYSSLRTWRRDGTLETLHMRLRERLQRPRTCHHAPFRYHRPPVGQDDRKRGPPRKPPTIGYDGGKKVKGHKRHLLVDTQGLVLKVLVHAADIADRDGGRLLLEARQTPPPVAAQFPWLSHLWVDVGYRGRFVTWVKDTLGWSVEVVKHWWTGVSKVWAFPGQEPPRNRRVSNC